MKVNRSYDFYSGILTKPDRFHPVISVSLLLNNYNHTTIPAPIIPLISRALRSVHRPTVNEHAINEREANRPCETLSLQILDRTDGVLVCSVHASRRRTRFLPRANSGVNLCKTNGHLLDGSILTRISRIPNTTITSLTSV